MKSEDRTFEEISVGSTAEFERTFSERDVAAFAKLSGDNNPLHMDESYAKTTPFRGRVVHGMLVASLTSTLLGMHLPGRRCLYLGEKLSFKKPVFIEDRLTIQGEVIHKSVSMRTLTIAITIRRDDEVVVSGEALAQVLQ